LILLHPVSSKENNLKHNPDKPEQKRFRVQSSTFQVEIWIISVF
jgi:hypothetical protein